MKKLTRAFSIFSVLVVAALACNLPTSTFAPAEDSTATQSQTLPTQAEIQNQNPTITVAVAPASDTPAPSLTPSTTPTLTPSIPMVSVSANTNCRKGPSIVYDNLAALLVGEEAEVIGKYTVTTPTYWIIKKGTVTCWLWGEYATVEGDTSKLPEMIPPPTPTPSPTPTPTATSTATDTPSPTPE